MKNTSTILKISGYVLLGLAFVILFWGIFHTWKNDNPIDLFAISTVVLIAVAVFCLSLSKSKESQEKVK